MAKNALTTGAASSMGRAIATRYVEQGANVAYIDINTIELESIVKTLENEQSIVNCITANVTVPERRLQLLKEAEISGFVCNGASSL